MNQEKLSAFEMLTVLRKRGIELVPDDNGHSWHKFSTYREDWKISNSKIASIVGDEARNPMVDVDKKPINTYAINGTNLVCANDLKHQIDIRVNGYQYSAENIALTACGIDKLRLFNKKIVLGTTAPIGRQKSDDLVAKIRDAYSSSNIVRLNDGLQCNIIEVLTYGEGLMAAYDWFITDDGKINKEAKKDGGVNRILCIDIGGGTTDVVTITNQSAVTIDSSNTGTIEGCGIIDVMREIKMPLDRALRKAFNDKGMGQYFTETTNSIIEETLLNNGVWRSNSFDIQIDISKEVKEVRESFVVRMLQGVTSIVNNMGNFQKILIVGGGALLLGAEIRARLPFAVYLDEFSNSKGLLKVMTHIWLPRNFERIMDSMRQGD